MPRLRIVLGPVRKQPARGRRQTKRSRGARRGPFRRRLAVVSIVVGLVATAAVLVHLQVQLSRRFDGRLFKVPARVYADGWKLEVGEPIDPSALVRHLERSGYARTDGPPHRPGQYRTRPGGLDLHLRPFASPAGTSPARGLRLAFDRGELSAIVDSESGSRLDRVDLEPEVLAILYGTRQEERRLVRLDDLPRPLLHAVLAAEDARFYHHHGLEARGIARAAWTNLRSARIVQGGSTITQQTVKNLFLSQERTWWRKAREAVMAVLLDARYEKERILETYLNEVYLGQRGPVAVCGVGAAARHYFGRDPADLSLAESAMLAGLIRNPGGYNPFARPERAVARRNLVLDAMHRLGYVSDGDRHAARNEPLDLAMGTGSGRAPHAVDLVRNRLADRLSARELEEEGLRIYTTIDTRWQEAAEEALQAGLERLERDVPGIRGQVERRRLEGAVVVTRPTTGAVLAIVGGRDWARSQFNRAVSARRQPGSCFKPFVFAAGFEAAHGRESPGLTPATLLEDRPFEMVSGGQRWRPENHDGTFRGPVTVRRTLEESLNVPTVRAAQHVGLQAVIDTARRCGIESPLDRVPSLALGAEELTPIELAAAYGTLAHDGRRVRPWIVREVHDAEGGVLVTSRPEVRQVLHPETAWLVADVLRGVFSRGTARTAASLGYHGSAAGKTGTTDDARDAWFVGYTSELLALVWVGYDDNARTGLTGATGALPIWVDLVERVAGSGGEEPRPAEEPPGLIPRRIDPTTGGLATARCPQVIEEFFMPGTEPVDKCPEHGRRLRRWFRKVFGRGGA